MFGYISTDTPNLYVKDTVLYRSMYCGLCKSLGKTCGKNARLVLNYDLTFLSILLHNIESEDVVIKKQRCAIHLIKKHPIAVPDELTNRIACFNVILAYYKCTDDIIDSKKGNIKRGLIKHAYKKAKKKEPKIDEIVKKCLTGLFEYEKTNGDSIDISADFFGELIKQCVGELKSNADENLLNLSYNLGKWIYLIDALDDFDKDIKSKNYNVFVNTFTDVKSKENLVKNHKKELDEIFNVILYSVNESASKLSYKFNHDLTDNIIKLGLLNKTKNIMENKKCKNLIKY